MPRAARFILVPVGSAGDVHPYVGLGRVLRDRGHEVFVLTNAHFKPLIRRSGLHFVEIGTEDDYDRFTRDPDLWHPRRGLLLVPRRGGLEPARAVHDAVARLHRPGATVVAASALAFGARLAHETLGLPLATIHLQPFAFPSLLRPPRPPFLAWTVRLPYPFRRLAYGVTHRLADRLFRVEIDTLRTELGLQPLQTSVLDWLHSPQRVIGLFPDWFAPPQSDWPDGSRLTGFPLFDESPLTPVEPEVVRFLDDGPLPLAFTAGSAMRHAARFFDVSAQICRRLRRRGLFLTGHPEQLPASQPPDVLHASYVPFSLLLPRCALLVHHGGIGTTSQALAAGVPQLVVPRAFDQPDNAERLIRLGVGDALGPRRYTPARGARVIEQLLNDPAMSGRCADVASRIRPGLDETCDLLESLIGTDRKQSRDRLPVRDRTQTGEEAEVRTSKRKKNRE